MNSTEAILKFSKIALLGQEQLISPDGIDFEELYNISVSHSIVGIVAKGLKLAGIKPEPQVDSKFEKRCMSELYQYMVQDGQLPLLCNALEKAEIPYIVLKGSRMRRYYPSPELRTSCDIDLLVKADDEQKMNVMLSLGYTYHPTENGTMNFVKPPALEVELHKTLFDDKLDFHSYFGSVWERAVLADGKQYEYLLTEEDFYAYMIAHFAKHFTRYGSGIRNLFDIYLYHHNPPKEFDSQKASAVLKEIGLYEFDQKTVRLAETLFGEQEFTEADMQLTDYILGCGIYGNSKNREAIKLKSTENISHKKTANNVKYIFPGLNIMGKMYPVLKKCPVLLPVFWPVRWCRVFTPKRKKVAQRFQQYKSIDKDYVDYVDSMLKELNLK